MIIKQTGSSITLGDVIFSGMFVESLEAGEGITALDVCYIETDGKAYQLDDSMTTKINLITVMALETLTTGKTGRFLLKGEVEYLSWDYSPGNLIIIPSSKGTVLEEAE